MIYVLGLGFDGCCGMLQIWYVLCCFVLLVNVGGEQVEFMFDNMWLDLVFMQDKELKKFEGGDIDKLCEQWLQCYSGLVGKNGVFVVLIGGMDIKQISIIFEDVQLLEMFQFLVEDIVWIFGVLLYMIGYIDKIIGWGSGVE